MTVTQVPHRTEESLALASIRVDSLCNDSMLQRLQQGVNWQRLFEIANYNKIIPLVYQYMKSLPDGSLPEKQLDDFKALFINNAHQNLRLSRKLVWIVDTLAEMKIEAIPFKGPAFAVQAFGDLSMRQFTDLDILVRKNDLYRAISGLENKGLVSEIDIRNIGSMRAARLNKDWALTYQGEHIELHGEIIEGSMAFPVRPERFWQNCQPVSILGHQVMGLSLENNLFMVCMQAAADHWDQLKWAADITYLCKTAMDQVDWSEFLRKARQIRIFRIVCLGLMVAEMMGGVIFPPLVHHAIYMESAAKAAAKMIVERPVASNERISGTLGNVPFYLSLREAKRDRLYYLFEQTFIPKQVDWVEMPLPAILSPMYYILRPVRLAGKLGLNWLRSRKKGSAF